MCTFYWQRNNADVRLWFNRDEQRSRPRAELPIVRHLEDRQAIYALDPLGGGTWLGVNDNGIVVGLLNFYSDNSGESGKMSRGQLVTECLSLDSLIKIDEFLKKRFKKVDAHDYGAFELFVINEKTERYFRYDGSKLENQGRLPEFLTSSSFESDAVIISRKEQWKQCGQLLQKKDLNIVEELMRLRNLNDLAYGICMDRSDAQTVSMSCIEIVGDKIRYRYLPREVSGFGFEAPVEVLMQKR